MPANYTHYRFARQLLPQVQRHIGVHTALYYAGCHGPDPLFYYQPFWDNAVKVMADRCHNHPGREFFSRGCALLRQQPSDRGAAYLWGVLTHYCLDSVCHPYVNDLAAGNLCDHTELETEFDRFLLALDGEAAPHTRDLSAHILLPLRDCREAARFYPGLTGKQLRRSMRNMKLSSRILAGKTVLPQSLLRRSLPAFAPAVHYQLMTEKPNPRVEGFCDQLLALYNRSAERFPILARQLEESLTRGTPLGKEFDLIFG